MWEEWIAAHLPVPAAPSTCQSWPWIRAPRLVLSTAGTLPLTTTPPELPLDFSLTPLFPPQLRRGGRRSAAHCPPPPARSPLRTAAGAASCRAPRPSSWPAPRGTAQSWPCSDRCCAWDRCVLRRALVWVRTPMQLAQRLRPLVHHQRCEPRGCVRSGCRCACAPA